MQEFRETRLMKTIQIRRRSLYLRLGRIYILIKYEFF